ncbi:hypothetical protein GCM10009764_41540 [Nocardia ninae]|uniref:Uncharacterized protein n=1 Tax=Nocardia ninae NBRC 108245 TaxID=1210091 RepID=A0A511MA79_9NOCA|nr:hypothetical protein NN4_20930 [Nocardia ninae NBRC 108245]
MAELRDRSVTIEYFQGASHHAMSEFLCLAIRFAIETRPEVPSTQHATRSRPARPLRPLGMQRVTG